MDSVSLKKPKSNQIDAEIDYTAQDSIVLLGNGTGFLHGKGDVKYKNIELKAEFVRVKMDSSLIFAKGRTDSVGKKIGEPVFTEGKTEYSSKELTYNLRTKKGYIRQAVTKQGEGYVISDKTKKVGNDILCITDGKYTTCDNHEHPDFYLDLTRGKIKTGKYIVTGPAYLVIEDVPLPIAIPFGFFPFTDKYSSGIMMPTFQDEQTRGFGLTNGGYYFAINDYMDLDLKADIYTKGTWAFTANSRYIKRYKYSGNFSFSYRDDVISEKGLPDYKSSPSMNITWSHSQDAKANPFFTFSSSVNYSSSGYNQNNINNYYRPEINSNNTKSSTVNFTKRFPDSPFSLNGSMNVTQRTSDSTINLSLPNLSISMSSIYPFKRKDAIGKDRWYEKISFSYTGSFQNSIQTKENKLLSSSFTKDWKNGMIHNIPVTANFNLLKYITISPSINYTERWLFQSINESWDKKNQKLVTDTISGFNRVFDFNMGVSASTKLYGFYIPSRAIFGDKIDRIRHVLTPSISFTYAPNFGDPMWGYYGTYVKSVSDISNPAIFHDQVVQYSHYQNSLYQAPGVGKSGNIGFSLTNNVEMKVRNDKDTTGTKPFIIKSLIDNLSITGGYNMAADSMQWQNFNASIRLKLGKNYSLSLSSAFDPYVYVSNAAGNGGVRINRLLWNSGKLPRFLGTSTSYSYTLSNETFKKKSDKKNNSTVNNNSPDQVLPTKNDSTFNNKVKTDSEKDKKAIDKDIDGYQKLTIPWSLSINYSVMYGQGTWNPKKIAYDMALTHNLSFSGNIALTTNWKISATTAYDFHANQFTYTNVNVIRNLHCWTMTASIVPFGPYKSYNFRIGVNASMLQDLKYNKQSGYGTTPITWY
ncbi:MAG: putative LPS assembly protein LptD [Paludibacter sp.]|nr:putative LPS assembly protein LptD [Paludibacter sp.]